MSVIADFSVPHTDFALGRLLEVRPGIEIRLESMIPTGEAVMPYFWVSSADAEAVADAIRDDPLIEEVEVVDELGGEVLFRVEWSPEINGLVDAVLDSGAAVLAAEGQGDDWSMQLRFADYDALSAFYRDCARRDISLDLKRIHDPSDGVGREPYGLTSEQRETILTALETGYYAVPRETTLVELGERLGVSDSAVSQRLRRGLSKLVSSTLGGTRPGQSGTRRE